MWFFKFKNDNCWYNAEWYISIEDYAWPEEWKFKFGDCVKYHNEWSNYDNCEWVVLEQRFHRCYQDYETKVNIKLQNWWYTDVRMRWSNLEKLQGWD